MTTSSARVRVDAVDDLIEFDIATADQATGLSVLVTRAEAAIIQRRLSEVLLTPPSAPSRAELHKARRPR